MSKLEEKRIMKFTADTQGDYKIQIRVKRTRGRRRTCRPRVLTRKGIGSDNRVDISNATCTLEEDNIIHMVHESGFSSWSRLNTVGEVF